MEDNKKNDLICLCFSVPAKWMEGGTDPPKTIPMMLSDLQEAIHLCTSP